MEEMLACLPLIGFAIIAVTVIDTLGAMASRWFKFNYGRLTFLSLTVYTLLGYYCSGMAGIRMVLIAGLIVGTYDATVGLKLSRLCKPNMGNYEEEMANMSYSQSLMIIAIVAPLFCGIGYLLHNN